MSHERVIIIPADPDEIREGREGWQERPPEDTTSEWLASLARAPLPVWPRVFPGL
jgi:hypothetical protein